MKIQNKSGIAYMFRNFGGMVLYAIVPSVLLALFCDFSTVSTFAWATLFANVNANQAVTLVLECFTLLRFGNTWYLSIVAIVTLAFVFAVYTARIGRHMRVGMAEENMIRNAIPFYFEILVAVVIFVVIGEFMQLILAGVCSLVALSGSGKAVMYCACALEIGVVALYGYLISIASLALPSIYYEGFHINVAISYSVRTISKNPQFNVANVVGITLSSVFVCLVGGLLSSISPFEHFDYAIILYFVFYMFWMMYYPSFSFTTYYNVTDGERRDITRVIFS